MYKNVFKYDEMKRGEHMAVRNNVGWYLWTHQLVEVTGPDATAFLELLCANPIGNLKIGKERYTTMLDDDGLIIDDVVIFRWEEQKYWISTLFCHRLWAWYDAHKGDLDVNYVQITKQYHMYAVQGPKALELVNGLAKETVDDLKFFSFRENEINGFPVIINRAGFTGEKYGYEIYAAADKADELEALIRAEADKLGGRQVTDFQIMAWTLPTEAGFYYMRDLSFKNPLEVGLDKGIGWDKEFVGKQALLKIREAGPANEMLGFTIEEADIHVRTEHLGGPGEPVYVDGELVGRVQKCVYSYVREINNGYIFAKKGVLKPGDKVLLHGHEAVICEPKFI